MGSAGCFCGEGGACDGDLQCLSDRCVRMIGSSKSQDPDVSCTSSLPKASNTTNFPSSFEPGIDTASPDSSSLEKCETKEFGHCEDGAHNALETDIDCGGPDCASCSVGQACLEDRDCRSRSCVGHLCVQQIRECNRDIDCDDNQPCTVNRCNANHHCESKPVEDGTVCNDQDSCTSQDRCIQGACVGKDTRVLFENFSAAPHRFLNGPASKLSRWEIAPAKASDCAPEGFVEDPALDHSSDGANGVMGVSVGGCQHIRQDNHQDCAWSDLVDVSHFESDIVFSYWRHLSSPGNGPMHQRTPLVTNSIYYFQEGEKAPRLIESGWPQAVNDTQWVHIRHRVPSTNLGKVALGICYKRLGSQRGFAGWTVDDVYIRQNGCDPQR